MGKGKAKGTRAENGVVAVFSPLFPYCERRALRGKNDAGDLCGLPIVVEVKCSIAYVAEAMKEAKAAAARQGQLEYAVVCHARGKNPSEDYGVVPAWFLAELLHTWDKGKVTA
jgi:hypothetical protein